jgi:hypothetical protein
MTGIIAQEMGEVVRGSIHYRALFMVGLVLFFIPADQLPRAENRAPLPHLHRMKPMSDPQSLRPSASPRRPAIEKVGVSSGCAATYFVLLCGVLVFGTSSSRARHGVFKTRAPFINVPFLTEAPESLYVFEYQGKKAEMGDRAFAQFREEKETERRAVAQSRATFIRPAASGPASSARCCSWWAR